MKRKLKKRGQYHEKASSRESFLIIITAFAVLLSAIYINHRIHLKLEAGLLVSPGQLVEVDGYNMSVYREGSGDTTLVFLSGGGTCSPILDFKSLYSRLSDEFSIAVVEKFGYGFSDITGRKRDIDSILEDTRSALAAAGAAAPYVLCPHSMSGLEALYWANKYPDEVSAIVGLDMAVQEYYDSMDINIPLMRAAGWAANIGVTRLIPGISDSDAIRHGTLSEREKGSLQSGFLSPDGNCEHDKRDRSGERKCQDSGQYGRAAAPDAAIPFKRFRRNGLRHGSTA